MKTSIIAEKANRRLARPRLKTKTVDLNAFWDVVMDLLKGGALAKTCFKLINRRIYFMSHEVAAAAATGIKDLTREDLRRALQAEKYWVPGKYKQRFGEKGNRIEIFFCACRSGNRVGSVRRGDEGTIRL